MNNRRQLWRSIQLTVFFSGGVGDWKNWFTVKDNEIFDKYIEENMRYCKWKFTYCI